VPLPVAAVPLSESLEDGAHLAGLPGLAAFGFVPFGIVSGGDGAQRGAVGPQSPHPGQRRLFGFLGHQGAALGPLAERA
jgi:hypothetical protein